MDEIKFLGIGVPEERGGFLVERARDGLNLEIGACLAIESVVDSYRRGLIECHQFRKLGEDRCH